MSEPVSETRELAAKVADWLVARERSAEAVGLLVAWAARGPNDAQGQALLAEALRLDPGAKSAQQAFEQMEGITGDHRELNDALRQFDEETLNALTKDMQSPTFRRAQIGFNNNIRAKNQVFHIQTEDSGLNSPHVITHLFADGGRVIKSTKRTYASAVTTEPDIATYVRGLMKAQHLEMVFALRNGKFDRIIAGEEIGGLEELDEYPDVDLSKLGGRTKEEPRPQSPAPGAAAPSQPLATAAPGVDSTVGADESPVSPDAAAPDVVSPAIVPPPLPAPAAAMLAANHPAASPMQKFSATRAVAPPSAQAVSSRYSLSPAALASLPPARIPHSLRGGSDKRDDRSGSLPADSNPSTQAIRSAPGHRSPAKRSTAPLYALHVLRCLGGGPARYSVSRRMTVIGSGGEITLPGEAFCHPREATLSYEHGRLWLESLQGENGVFLRIHKPQVLQFGEEFLVGDQLLRVEDNPVSDDAPDPAPTYFYSSPRWPSAFRLVQIFEGGARGACLVARGTALQVGSVIGDLILGDDPLVEPQHCVLEEQAGTLILTDLDSRNGVFLRTRSRQELVNGDELVIGRTHLVVSIPQPV